MNTKANFSYHKLPYRYINSFVDGKWGEGELSEDERIILNESACVLHYCQVVFEGLKAFKTIDGRIVCFRPDMNEKRLESSCKQMNMPIFPKEKFLAAVEQVVKANKEYIPSFEEGGSLYIRPIMYGTTPTMGVKSAKEFEIRFFAVPVGNYFDANKTARLRVSDVDRAAPKGTGNIKAGLNYAMSLSNITDAHNKGFNENLYLDPKERKYVEETGGANIFFIKDNKVIFPYSESILPSITKMSTMYIAKEILHLEIEERKVTFQEIKNFDECALCGTASTITPVGLIDDHGHQIIFSNDVIGPITSLLLKTLKDIQHGIIPAPKGWLYEIK